MDDEFDDPHTYESATVGALIWLLVPFTASRLAAANVSPTAGEWAGPSLVVVMLAWAAYRPTRSPLKMALLRAVDTVVTFLLVLSIPVFIVAIVVADYHLAAVHRLAWFTPLITAGCVTAKFGIRRWVRYSLRRTR